MNEIGLYYPYFHVRDDTWLKAAALYLPQLARVRPKHYPVRDSPTAEVLRGELDFLLDIDPAVQAEEVGREFGAFVDREHKALRKRYRSKQRLIYRGLIFDELTDGALLNKEQFAWVHKTQLGDTSGHVTLAGAAELSQRLTSYKLAVTTRFDPLTGVRDDYRWLGMHPHLVAVYSCVLADRIAQANSLTMVTDDRRMFTLSGEWTIDNLGHALLDHPNRPSSRRGRHDLMSLYAVVALKAVIPADLEHVPVDKIVRARRSLAEEFQAFRAHLDGLEEQFAQLGEVEDVGIVQAHVRAMVHRDLTKPMEELERGLRVLGMKPARAVLGLKSVELPAVAALAAHAVGLPTIVGAGGMATVQLMTSIHSARRDARTQRTSAPGYLLGIRREFRATGRIARWSRRRLAAIRHVKRPPTTSLEPFRREEENPYPPPT